ncbi:MAG: 30S ribosomal protein S18, partial [Spirochaetota bacterium]
PASSAHDERPSGRPSHREDSQNDSRRDSRHRDNQDSGDRRQRFSRFKKKVCKFCHNKELPIDYKRPDILLRFLTDRGKILPRRITGTCAKHQRRMASEVKRSRMIALLPFVEQ